MLPRVRLKAGLCVSAAAAVVVAAVVATAVIAAAVVAAAIVAAGAVAAASAAAATAAEQDDYKDDEPYGIVAVVAEHDAVLSPCYELDLQPLAGTVCHGPFTDGPALLAALVA